MHSIREPARAGRSPTRGEFTSLSERVYPWKPRFHWRFVLRAGALFGESLDGRLFVASDHLGDRSRLRWEKGRGFEAIVFPNEFGVP